MAKFDSNRFMSGLSVDCVIFGFHQKDLKLLLLKLKYLDDYMLPGGFVPIDMNADQAASVVLHDRTGLKNIFLRQFHVFGATDRINLNHVKHLIETEIITPDLEPWFSQRFVSIGYYALVDYEKVGTAIPDATSDKCDWYSVSDLPHMLIDHRHIVETALHQLKLELNYQPIGLNLLPKEFTMPELQQLYEAVLGKPLDRRNFRRKILSFDILTDTGKRRKGGAHKAPILYKFNLSNYNRAMKEGLSGGW